MREPLCSDPLQVSRIIPDIDAHLLRHKFVVGESDRSGQALVSNLQATTVLRLILLEV